ncbi:GspE/PulE family protein [Candidatus Saccharibacteria bacterium]|nr:GspE/PulE family protein [Candidatus Saccharibacteria bacterium]
MRISDALVIGLLKESRKVSDEQLNGLLEQQKTEKKPLQDLVVKNSLLPESDLTKLYASKIDVPFVELIPKNLKKEIFGLIPEHIARQYNAILFDIQPNGTRMLAMEDPDDVQAFSFLQKQLGSNIKVYIATRSNILAALEQYRTNISNELSEVVAEGGNAGPTEEEVSEADVAEDSPVAKTVNLIIEFAIKQGASDIHIEPREDYVAIRYRIDGQLRETNRLPKKIVAALVSRIKILSNLKIDERRAPQDGRFKVTLGSGEFALRVSTLPIVDGEKVVMRILDESSKASTFKELGFWGTNLETLETALTQPNGLILFTGPTGSGKSTSLFSILSRLNQPSVNISTVEDPVEYKIPGVNQVQVNPLAGMTFVNGLRALLRQDPNIIMVGEIRDSETANLAIQAALTGHLVFSTLHTNNAATTLPRLLDMGIEPFLIASTVRAVVAQRLVRKLVIDNTEIFHPDEATVKRILTAFHLNNPGDMERIHNLELQAVQSSMEGVLNSSQVIARAEASTTTATINKLWRLKGQAGAQAFRGRIGIYEVLSITPEIQRLIIKGASAEEINAQSIKDGMVTMQTDGLIKALQGQTTLEEIMRVTNER